MALPKNSTTGYFDNIRDAVGFVTEVIRYSKFDYPSIMTIAREKSGDYSVRIVTDTSLEDTENRKAWPYLEQLQTI